MQMVTQKSFLLKMIWYYNTSHCPKMFHARGDYLYTFRGCWHMAGFTVLGTVPLTLFKCSQEAGRSWNLLYQPYWDFSSMSSSNMWVSPVVQKLDYLLNHMIPCQSSLHKDHLLILPQYRSGYGWFRPPAYLCKISVSSFGSYILQYFLFL